MDTGHSLLQDRRVRSSEGRARIRRSSRSPGQAPYSTTTACLAQGLSEIKLGGQSSCKKEPTNILFGKEIQDSGSPVSHRGSGGACFVDGGQGNNGNKKSSLNSGMARQDYGAPFSQVGNDLPPLGEGMLRDGFGGWSQGFNGCERWSRAQGEVFSTLKGDFPGLQVDNELPNANMNGFGNSQENVSVNLGGDSCMQHSRLYNAFGEASGKGSGSAHWVNPGNGATPTKKRLSSQVNDPVGCGGFEKQGVGFGQKETHARPNPLPDGVFRAPFTMGAPSQGTSSTKCRSIHAQKAHMFNSSHGIPTNFTDRASTTYEGSMEDAEAHLASGIDGMKLDEDVQYRASSQGTQSCIGNGFVHEVVFEHCLKTNVKVVDERTQFNKNNDEVHEDIGQSQDSRASTSQKSHIHTASFVHGKGPARTHRRVVRRKSSARQATQTRDCSSGWIGTSFKHNESEETTKIRSGDNTAFPASQEKETAYSTVENASWFGSEKKVPTERTESPPNLHNGMHSVPCQSVHIPPFFTAPTDSPINTMHSVDTAHKDVKGYYETNPSRSSISSPKKHQKVMHSTAHTSTVGKMGPMDVDNPVCVGPLPESQPFRGVEERPSQFDFQSQLPVGVSSRRCKFKAKRKTAGGMVQGREGVAGLAVGVQIAGEGIQVQVGCSRQAAEPGTCDEAAQNSIRKAKDAGKTLRESANSMYSAEKYPEAEAIYTKGISIMRLHPSSELRSTLACLLSNRAASRLMLNRPQEALQDSQDAIAADAKYIKAYLRCGTCYLQLGMFKCGKSVLDRAASMLSAGDSNYSLIVRKIAEVDAAEEKCAELKAALLSEAWTEVAIKEVIRKAKCLYSIATHSELASGILACALLRGGLYREALTHVETAFKQLGIDKLGERVQIWWAWIRVQLRWQIQGETDRALEETKMLLKVMEMSDLNELDCPLNHGCKASAEELRGFIASISLVLEQKEYGNKQVKQGSYKLAVESYTKALAHCNDCGAPPHFVAVLHSNRGSAYYGLKKYAEAIGDCCRARALSPEFPRPLSRLAQILSETCQPDAAVAVLQEMLDCPGLNEADRGSTEARIADAQRAAISKPTPHYYRILGVQEDSAEAVVKKAYKLLALRFHPDKAAVTCKFSHKVGASGIDVFGSGKTYYRVREQACWLFKSINEAHAALSDHCERQKLDLELEREAGRGSVRNHQQEGVWDFWDSYSPGFRHSNVNRRTRHYNTRKANGYGFRSRHYGEWDWTT